MNIRKFVGATSRDALRLVREALGPDAVVLSNRTMDDGSVEIVALADSDLAAITPKAPRGSAGAALAMPTNATAATNVTTATTGQQAALAVPRAQVVAQQPEQRPPPARRRPWPPGFTSNARPIPP